MTRPTALQACACLLALLSFIAGDPPAHAQTVTIVGTQHLRGLDPAPSPEQLNHAVEAMSAFQPTQVCVERMSGERLQALSQDLMRHGMALSPDTHGRPLGTQIIPLGKTMQTWLEVRPADARDRARDLASRWDELDFDSRIELIGLQIAGYEFHSAVLNWSYLSEPEREAAAEDILASVSNPLTDMLNSVDEVYSLAVPLARQAGLHALCTADSQEYEAAGMRAAIDHGGMERLSSPDIASRLEAYMAQMDSVWQPDSGADALTRMLAYMNSESFVEYDLENQWELLREYDNADGAFQRRLMYWHARTAQISSELFRALAQGQDERVLFIVGAAHRAFNEAELRSQPWVSVEPAAPLFEASP